MSEVCAGAYEKVTRTKLEELERRFDKHEETQAETLKEIRQELKTIREKLEGRLPVWVTVLFTLGGGLVGALLTAVLRG